MITILSFIDAPAWWRRVTAGCTDGGGVAVEQFTPRVASAVCPRPVAHGFRRHGGRSLSVFGSRVCFARRGIVLADEVRKRANDAMLGVRVTDDDSAITGHICLSLV